ncbi:MAG: T9SS type A sorting domain-containing protein [Candidatus Krumholzibacteriota bacterium]
MKVISVCLCLAVGITGLSLAAEPRLESIRHEGGSHADGAKAVVDTLLLMGAHGEGAPHIGTFESPTGSPDWNGWTSIDITQETESYWHVDTFKAVTGTYSVWCGSMDVLSCWHDDPDGGYGANYNERLEWRGTVADPALPCTVSISTNYHVSTMPGYDFFFVSVELPDNGLANLLAIDGHYDDLSFAGNFVYQPEDYVGPNADEVVVLFRGTSDGGWDGADCTWPNDGIAQVDDVVITLSNGTGYSHDFENGTLGDFQIAYPPGVGDYAQLWSGLPDLDPCVTNDSPQVAFIDDGLVVPGTGGSFCIDWCYGPNGYVVNSTGGLSSYPTPWRDRNLHNAVESPPMAWDNPDHDGALLSYSVYRHENLDPESAGIFYTWAVRSVSTGDPADLAGAEWQDHGFVYYGGPNYQRETKDLRDLLVPGRTHVQVQLGAYELGWVWGWDGNNTTPAPYLDNVRLQTFPAEGPGLSATTEGLATDGFPANGGLDLVNLGANSVPFDASAHVDVPLAPQDSLLITCVPVGTGAVLAGPPRLHYNLRRNTLFDAYRTSGLPDVGSVPCAPTGNDSTTWAADLPDQDFLFPGDRLHYYFAADQDIGGQIESSVMPADTTGFSDFSDFPVINGGYDPAFAVRGLPTVSEVVTAPGTHETPRVLFWHDSGTNDDWAVWTSAFQMTGLSGGGVDFFHTQGAWSGHWNGLGSRATIGQLSNYDVILYSSGEMPANTIAHAYDGIARPGVNDIDVLDGWLKLGDRNLLAFGNDLASDLHSGTAAQSDFLSTWFDVSAAVRDVKPLIDGQNAPLVLPETGNPVFSTAGSWLAYGKGCSSSPFFEGYVQYVADRFDALLPGVDAVRLANWTTPDRIPGYVETAAVLTTDAVYNARVILVPVDFKLILTDPNETTETGSSYPARVRLLNDVLTYFGHGGDPLDVVSVPGASGFSLTHYPNPFNPSTTISYTVAQPGRLSIKVYDLRGQLVRNLHDGHAATSGSMVWDGRRDDGEAASSGIYFYEARMRGEVRVGKMTLIK